MYTVSLSQVVTFHSSCVTSSVLLMIDYSLYVLGRYLYCYYLVVMFHSSCVTSSVSAFNDTLYTP